MELTPAAQSVLSRFAERTHMAGGPRNGYVLRRKAIAAGFDGGSEAELEAGLALLVEADLLKPSEGGEFFFLTGAGVERLESTAGDRG